ncbi:hypothetical protein IID21_02305 [Patescibacteria group bacterium]|nr:hypothetical protein [Patescibacteria group bacterium]
MVENGGRENDFDRSRIRFEETLRDLAAEKLGRVPTEEEMATFKKGAENNFPFIEEGRILPGTEWHSIQHEALKRIYPGIGMDVLKMIEILKEPSSFLIPLRRVLIPR